MNHNEIKERDARINQSKLMPTFKRDAFTEIQKWLKGTLRGVIIGGLRQIGKTTILKQIRQSVNDSIFINIDASIERHEVIQLENTLTSFYDSGVRLFLIDEIQNIKEWGNFITDLSNNLPDVKFIVSGSASLHAKDSRGSARFTTYNLLPLSFKEYCEYHKYSKKDPLKDLFSEYVGMTALFAYTDNDIINPAQVFKEYLESYFYVDIKKYNKNISKEDIWKIINFLKHNTSGEVIKSDLLKKGIGSNYKDLHSKYNYLDKHLKVLEDYHLIKKLDRYSFDGGKGRSYKIYLNPHLYLMLLEVTNLENLPNGNKGYFYESYIYFYSLIDNIKGYIKQSSNAVKFAKQEIDFITHDKWIEIKSSQYTKDIKKSLSKIFIEGNKEGISKEIISLDSNPKINGIKNTYFIDIVSKDIEK